MPSLHSGGSEFESRLGQPLQQILIHCFELRYSHMHQCAPEHIIYNDHIT